MSSGFIDLDGSPVDFKELKVLKASALSRALLEGKIEFARFLECRLSNGNEIVVFDLDIEIPQIVKYPINYVERIAAIFYKNDDKIPEVLAIRSDFPRVPHLNLRDFDLPRSLCLYEEKYSDIKRSWTPKFFIEQIRFWLAQTAEGALHQDDQSLEPFLLNDFGKILLPKELQSVETKALPGKLFLYGWETKNKRLFLVAQVNKPASDKPFQWFASIHKCQPRQHGLIEKLPSNLEELAHFAKKGGIDLVQELRDQLVEWLGDEEFCNLSSKAHLMIVLHCPKTRDEGSEPESVDLFAFLIHPDPIEQVGIKIDAWAKPEGRLGVTLEPDESKSGKDVNILMLNPVFNLTREEAAWLNGLDQCIDNKIVAIGAGALGSQVIMNMSRSATGDWTIIDDDIFLPHNLARHELLQPAIGVEKSDSTAFLGNNVINNAQLFKSIFANVIEPKDKKEEVATVLKGSDVVLDMSASVSVARFLAIDLESNARRISIFLNPKGDDLVLLSEDINRDVSLDCLEMQYYRSLYKNKNLTGHLDVLDGRVRYGRSCRDVTSRLSQDLIALHAAIGSQELKTIFMSENPYAIIWRAGPDGSVKRIDLSPVPAVVKKVGEWAIAIDEFFLEKVKKLRLQKLMENPPVETGGVLIGSLDMERKIVYVVDALQAPQDSTERPFYFKRGHRELKKQVEIIGKKTLSNLGYIGEWHSHPGKNTTPSIDDENVFSWLYEHINRDGLPTIMLIAGEKHVNCVVEDIAQSKKFALEETS